MPSKKKKLKSVTFEEQDEELVALSAIYGHDFEAKEDGFTVLVGTGSPASREDDVHVVLVRENPNYF